MNTVLEFRNVAMHYPYEDFPLLDDISFTLQKDEKLGIVIDSQSGKSTIAKLIVGLKVQTAGEILLGGTPLTQIPPDKRNIVVIYDDFALMRRKFWVNAAYPLKIRKISKKERKQKAVAALTKFGIADLAESRVLQKKTPFEQKLSLALARASLRQFDIVVFDDVFRDVDANFATAQIQKLTSDSKAAQLYLSSDVEKLHFCDKLILIAYGKNCFEGTFTEAENYVSGLRNFNVFDEEHETEVKE